MGFVFMGPCGGIGGGFPHTQSLGVMNTTVRAITAEDAHLVATIHAASWRSAYKGILREEFLQSDLVASRVALWTRRLSQVPQNHFGFISVSAAGPIGFAFAFGDEDPLWGTQLDNLHVLPDYKGKGVGKVLLSSIAQACTRPCRSDGLFLWVYEANLLAQSFYTSLGARRAEKLQIAAPGGGEVTELRYFWSSAKQLSQRLRSHDA